VRRGEFDRVRPGGEKQGLDYGQRMRGSGELRRRTAHSGELHGLRRRTATNDNGTSDERGVLERETNSSRGEWGGSAAFYREREVDGWSARERERRRRPSLAINGGVVGLHGAIDGSVSSTTSMERGRE